ncbi:MAG: hypothetical protein ACLRNQ_01905 [Flavonifractor plautii]
MEAEQEAEQVRQQAQSEGYRQGYAEGLRQAGVEGQAELQKRREQAGRGAAGFFGKGHRCPGGAAAGDAGRAV